MQPGAQCQKWDGAAISCGTETRPLSHFVLTVDFQVTHSRRTVRLHVLIAPRQGLLQNITRLHTHTHTHIHIYRVSQEERAKLQEGVPYVKLYRYNPKHLYPKLNGYGDNGKRSLKL